MGHIEELNDAYKGHNKLKSVALFVVTAFFVLAFLAVLVLTIYFIKDHYQGKHIKLGTLEYNMDKDTVKVIISKKSEQQNQPSNSVVKEKTQTEIKSKKPRTTSNVTLTAEENCEKLVSPLPLDCKIKIIDIIRKIINTHNLDPNTPFVVWYYGEKYKQIADEIYKTVKTSAFTMAKNSALGFAPSTYQWNHIDYHEPLMILGEQYGGFIAIEIVNDKMFIGK